MKRKVMLQLVVPLLSLCVLFLLLAMEPVESRRGTELVEVSVVLRQEDTTLWSTARQGMEQAAADLGAELRLLPLESAGSAREQADLLQREVDGGARAVVLVPADTDVLGGVVEELSAQVPVVTMETDMESWGACAFVGMDNAALGNALGQAALNGALRGQTVLLIDSVAGRNGVRQRLETAAAVLEEAGRTVRVCRAEEGGSLREAVSAAVEREAPALVLAFEAGALETAASVLEQMEGTAPLLYGSGATNTIAYALEQGWITAIAAQNEFAAGYLAVEAAVEAARKVPRTEVEPMEFSIVRKENMYDPANQKLLFPVTR